MLENLAKETDFGDCNVIRHFYSQEQDKLIICIERWNLKKIEFVFFSPILFICNYTGEIENFCRNDELTRSFSEALINRYGQIPSSHAYQLFQFTDRFDAPEIEVICIKYTMEKKP